MNTFFVGNHPVGHYVERFSAQRPGSLPLTTQKSKANASTALKQDLAQTQTMVDGEKTFFMKARILGGQADLSYSANGGDVKAMDREKGKTKGGKEETARSEGGLMDEIEDFKWLSKDEVETIVHPDYWIRIKNMLVAQ